MNPIAALQYNQEGKLRHFLSPEGLGQDTLTQILDTAERFLGPDDKPVPKVPLLRGRTVANLFFENSTRTRTTFDLAATRLSADLVTLDIARSSTSKGESIVDTLRNLEAMQCETFIVRHSASGAAHFIAQQVAPSSTVINAGDGRHAHPTQGMLDALTIRRRLGFIAGAKIAIVGDLLHSRVARSDIHAFLQLGAEVRAVGPKTLLPDSFAALGVSVHRDIQSGLADCDVVVMLRLQRERMASSLLPSAEEFYRHYGLNSHHLRYAAPHALVMHPGPINRGIEIANDVADGERSVILPQVTYGIAVRMAVLAMTMGVSA